MHSSHKSKSPSPFGDGHSSFPVATLCLLSALLLDQMVGTGALRCYQTQSTLQQPLQVSATDCPMMAYSCIKSVDYSQGLVTRACQSSNCTMGMSMSNSPVCQNSSSYPPQTFCCCYGDGCNSALRALGHNLSPLIAVLVTAVVGRHIIGIGKGIMAK